MKNKIPLKEIISMYTFYLNRIISKGISTEPSSLKIKSSQIYDNYSSLITQNYCIKYYHVTDTPRVMERSITYFLKKDLPPNTLMDIMTQIEDAVIDWTSPHMKRLKSAWSRQIKQNKPRLNKNELNDSEDYVKARQSGTALDSWNFIAQKNSMGCRTVDTEIVVKLFYPRNMTLKEQIVSEEQWMKTQALQGIKITPLKKNVKELEADLSLSRTQSERPLYNFYTWLDENVAFAESYLPGKLDGKQLFLGRDIITNMFVFSDLYDTDGGATNGLIYASVGSGKSFYAKFLCISFLSAYTSVIVWDKDGEYEKLCNSLGFPVIHLGKSGGSYFNTIPIMTVDNDVDNYMTSMQETMALFEILCSVDTPITTEEKYILQDAYNSLLQEAGVLKSHPDTWVNSECLSFHDLYRQLKKLTTITEDLTPYYNNLLRKLSTYFEPYGVNSSMFVNPIDMQDFLHFKSGKQPLMIDIVMDIMNNSNDTSDARVLEKIKCLTMSSLTFRLVKYNKSKHENTMLLAEEVQRYTDNIPFMDTLHTFVTGGRKLNMFTFLVMNALDSMTEGDNPKLRDILKNLNIHIVGSIPENTIPDAVKLFGLKDCEKALKKISKITSSSSNKDNPWYRGFLVRVKSKERVETTVVKSIVPPKMRDTIFKTRDDSKC